MPVLGYSAYSALSSYGTFPGSRRAPLPSFTHLTPSRRPLSEYSSAGTRFYVGGYQSSYSSVWSGGCRTLGRTYRAPRPRPTYSGASAYATLPRECRARRWGPEEKPLACIRHRRTVTPGDGRTRRGESTRSDDSGIDIAPFRESESSVDGGARRETDSTVAGGKGIPSEGSSADAESLGFVAECKSNCHKKCEKHMPNLCGVNEKLLSEALSTVKRGAAAAAEEPEEGEGRRPRRPSTPGSNDSDEGIDHSRDRVLSPTLASCPERETAGLPRLKYRKYSVDDFNFLKVLGRGSYGKVMLAELKNGSEYFAVKCLKKDVILEGNDVECTKIEKKVLVLGTAHPYICKLFCTFQTQSHVFFVMEYLSGGDLMFHIQQSGRFDQERARFYAAEIASALKFLHKKGIVYRDAKLDNIVLDAEGHVRLVDFGFCKFRIYRKECMPKNLCGTPDYMAPEVRRDLKLDNVMLDVAGHVKLSDFGMCKCKLPEDRTATFCGTPDYIAPEIIRGQKYNQSVDWWAFGVLLYEMLVGQSPFSGSDEEELFWSICNEEAYYPRFLSKEAKHLLVLLLNKTADCRLGMPDCPAGDVCRQPFFASVDWDKVERKELRPSFRPNLKGPGDVGNFDVDFTAEKAQLTPVAADILASMDQTQFRGFTYTNPNVTE